MKEIKKKKIRVWQKHKKEQFFPNIFFFSFFLYEYQYWTEKEERKRKKIIRNKKKDTLPKFGPF
jgi:hypothetical protein